MSRAALHTPSAPSAPKVPPSNTVGVYPRHPLLGGRGTTTQGQGFIVVRLGAPTRFMTDTHGASEDHQWGVGEKVQNEPAQKPAAELRAGKSDSQTRILTIPNALEQDLP